MWTGQAPNDNALQKRCDMNLQPIIGRVDTTFDTETKNLGTITGRSKPKIIKIGKHSFFLFDVLHERKRQCKASTVCGRQFAA